MADIQKSTTCVVEHNSKQSFSQQLRKILLVVFIILTTFVGIIHCENANGVTPSSTLPSDATSVSQSTENVSIPAANPIEQDLEQNLPGKAPQANPVQEKKTFLSKGLSYAKDTVYKFAPSKKVVPLGFWKGLFMMCCVALALSFKNFVTLFLVAVLYWMGLLYLPESCAWFKSYTCLFVLFILAGIEIFCSIVTSLIKIIMNEIAKVNKDFKESQLLISLLFIVPIIFFLGNKIMSETFFLLRWGICAGLIYFILEVRILLNYWAILKLICEVSLSWWLEPILLFVFLIAACIWLPVVGVLSFFMLLGIPGMRQELEKL